MLGFLHRNLRFISPTNHTINRSLRTDFRKRRTNPRRSSAERSKPAVATGIRIFDCMPLSPDREAQARNAGHSRFPPYRPIFRSKEFAKSDFARPKAPSPAHGHSHLYAPAGGFRPTNRFRRKHLYPNAAFEQRHAMHRTTGRHLFCGIRAVYSAEFAIFAECRTKYNLPMIR